MTYRRGDVVLAFYPFASGIGGKRRPALVLQSDADNARMSNTIVAQITSTISRAHLATQVLIEIATPEGQQSGLLHDSVASCNNLATIDQGRIQQVIGSLPAQLMQQVDVGFKAALGLP